MTSVLETDVLLENFAEARVVQLDVRFERRRDDIEVRDLALEQQLRVLRVVVPRRPHRFWHVGTRG